MHIEAITTQALAECDLTLVCAYPNDPATADAIRRAHPSFVNGSITANPDHLPVEQFLANHPLPLAGLLPPRATPPRGRGLWMAHQLCDQLYLWPHPTTIRLHMDRT